MTKKRLNKAVDRGFRLAGNVLMRRAIARLLHIDDASLTRSGLTRAAITDFLTTPLRTDPHRFFRHRRAPGAAAPVAHVYPATGSVRPTMAMRLRVLTAGALIGLSVLTACSGSLFEPDVAAARREQPASCHPKPERRLIVAQPPRMDDRVTARGFVLTYGQHPQHQHHAREGPAGDAV